MTIKIELEELTRVITTLKNEERLLQKKLTPLRESCKKMERYKSVLIGEIDTLKNRIESSEAQLSEAREEERLLQVNRYNVLMDIEAYETTHKDAIAIVEKAKAYETGIHDLESKLMELEAIYNEKLNLENIKAQIRSHEILLAERKSELKEGGSELNHLRLEIQEAEKAKRVFVCGNTTCRVTYEAIEALEQKKKSLEADVHFKEIRIAHKKPAVFPKRYRNIK